MVSLNRIRRSHLVILAFCMANITNSPVRLKDIARDLNVSVMTVSKVVRGCADVGAETRKRVLARIKDRMALETENRHVTDPLPHTRRIASVAVSIICR